MARSGLWISDFTGGIAHDDLAVRSQGYDGGHKVRAILAGNNDGTVTLHVGHQRVGGAKIDSDDMVCCHFAKLVLQHFIDIAQQVAQISATIQHIHHLATDVCAIFLKYRVAAVNECVPFIPGRLQFLQQGVVL